MILSEPFLRRADRADEPGAQIRFAPDPVVQFLAHGIEEESVDCEVAATSVSHRIAEGDLLRVPAILVIGFRAKGRDLKLAVSLKDDDHAELASNRNRALEKLLDL